MAITIPEHVKKFTATLAITPEEMQRPMPVTMSMYCDKLVSQLTQGILESCILHEHESVADGLYHLRMEVCVLSPKELLAIIHKARLEGAEVGLSGVGYRQPS